MSGKLPPVIVIVGPTGSGKSDLALELASGLKGEIVNCDSLQIYRYLDIGTAKTPREERRGIPHHLIDIVDPDQTYTAGDYSRAARLALRDVADRGRLPIVVGGTGFYLRALLEGLFAGPVRDPGIRARLEKRQPESMHRILRRLDPVAAARIHPNDRQKLMRALEVCISERAPITELHRTRETSPLTGFRILKVGLDPGRDDLRERLRGRSAHMFERGLADELSRVLDLGFAAESKALQSIGYKEAGLLLRGEIGQEEAVERTFIATAQYAKRQRTWFRRKVEVKWFRGFGTDPALQAAVAHHLSEG